MLGTDLEPAAVESARAAVYTRHATQDVPPAWLERCFAPAEGGGLALHGAPRDKSDYRF